MLTISGHAGYAEPGSDIVCAGVSALTGAVWAALREDPGFSITDDGNELRMKFDTAYGDHGAIVISAAADGIALIAANYPCYVYFTRQ